MCADINPLHFTKFWRTGAILCAPTVSEEKMIYEKNQKQKISWRCPFKTSLVNLKTSIYESAYIEVERLGSVLDDGGMLLLVLLRDGELLAPQHRLPPPREQAAHTHRFQGVQSRFANSESEVRLWHWIRIQTESFRDLQVKLNSTQNYYK